MNGSRAFEADTVPGHARNAICTVGIRNHTRGVMRVHCMLEKYRGNPFLRDFASGRVCAGPAQHGYGSTPQAEVHGVCELGPDSTSASRDFYEKRTVDGLQVVFYGTADHGKSAQYPPALIVAGTPRGVSLVPQCPEDSIQRQSSEFVSGMLPGDLRLSLPAHISHFQGVVYLGQGNDICESLKLNKATFGKQRILFGSCVRELRDIGRVSTSSKCSNYSFRPFVAKHDDVSVWISRRVSAEPKACTSSHLGPCEGKHLEVEPFRKGVGKDTRSK